MFRQARTAASKISRLAASKARLYTTASVSVVRRRDRGFIFLEGKDTEHFLQNLCSNDITKLAKGGSGAAGIFQPTGRMLFDIIYHSPDACPHVPLAVAAEHGSAVLVECDLAVKDNLLAMLKKYRLRSKVKITDLSDEFESVRILGPQKELSSLKESAGALSGALVEDPRHRDLGLSAVVPNSMPLDLNTDVTEADENVYHAVRISNGVGEGSVDHPPQATFPLQVNLELLNGISFNKKCYLGQELTARTYYRGVTRKRLMPVIGDTLDGAEVIANHGYHPSGGPLPPAGAKLSVNGKSIGEMRTSVGNVGLALVKVDKVADGPISVTAADYSGTLSVHPPDWMPEKAFHPEQE